MCPWPGPSFTEAKASFGQLPLTEDKLREIDARGWELYHVAQDSAETKNLADAHRDKLIEMIALWYAEAGKYDVFPIDSRGTLRFADERPQLAAARSTYVYFATAAFPDQKLAVPAVGLYLIVVGITSALYLAWFRRRRVGLAGEADRAASRRSAA